MRFGFVAFAGVMVVAISADASSAELTSAAANLGNSGQQGGASGAHKALQPTKTSGFAKAVAASLTAVGDLYRDGQIVPADAERALGYYRGLHGSDSAAVIYAIISPADLVGRTNGAPVNPGAAAELYHQAAAMGSPEALMRLGDLYWDGRAVAPDLNRAFHFYDRAAKAGSIEGKLRVGEMMARGQGVPRDIEGGLAFIGQLADAGNAEALVLLGDLHRPSEQGVVVADPAKAFGYYRRAADTGSDTGKLRVGEMVAIGQGTTQDVEAAVAIIEEVVSRSRNPAGLVLLGSLYSRPGGSVIAIDQTKAFQYFKRAADAGDESGKLHTGEMLARGFGTAKDYAAGRAMLTALASKGNTYALVSLGDLLSDATIAPVDVDAAVAAYEKASSLGRADALVRLGDLYSRNAAVVSDLPRAFAYYRRAGDGGDLTGRLRVGEMTALGQGTARNVTAGLAMINSLAEMDDPGALAMLGAFYQGSGAGMVKPDLATAFGYFQKAADAGSVTGAIQAGEMLARGQGTKQDAVRGRAQIKALGDAGNSDAMMSLAALLIDGSAGPVDPGAAVNVYEKAAKLGRTDALVRVGDFYRQGGAVPADPVKAFQYYDRARMAGNETGKLRVGEMTALGEGTQQDIKAGLSTVAEVGTGGDTYAYILLGDLHLSGRVGPIDGPAAVAAYENAAMQGREDALLRLGDVYRDGKGVPADGKKAADYYLKAVNAEALGPSTAGESVRY